MRPAFWRLLNSSWPPECRLWKTCYFNTCRYIIHKLIGSEDALSFYTVLVNTFSDLNWIFPQILVNINFSAWKKSRKSYNRSQKAIILYKQVLKMWYFKDLLLYPFQIRESFVCVHTSGSKYSWFSVTCILGATKPTFSRKYFFVFLSQ